MKFLDSNIFVYAFYKSKRQLSPLERSMKDSSKRIVTNVENGSEEVLTTVVHVSEVVNITKNSLSPNELGEMVRGLLSLDNLEVLGVDKSAYLAAAELGEELEMDSNDALAVQVMYAREVHEIYSFDGVFDRVQGIARLPKKKSFETI